MKCTCLCSALTVLWIALLSVPSISGANILFLIGLSSHSHRVSMQPLAVKLADLGHNVTFLSAQDPEKPSPKIREVTLEPVKKALMASLDSGSDGAVFGRLKSKHFDFLFNNGNTLWDMYLFQLRLTVEDPEFLKFTQEETFDLIISDMPIRELAAALGYKMNCKVIMFYSGGAMWMQDLDLFGYPDESSALPDLSLGSPYSWIPDHFYYAYNALHWYWSFKSYYLPRVDALFREYLGDGLPPSESLLRKIDLIFVNEHFSYLHPKALPPFVVPVGGMHNTDAKGILPKDLEDFVSKAKDGFVYISFGSIIKVTRLPQQMQEDLFNAVDSFKNLRFLWKWEGDVPDNLPRNVLTRKWFPQQDLLAHPDCRGFVTQGGAMSFQQAVHYAVPVVVVPVWYDQPALARSASQHGIGIHLELSELTRETFQQSLEQIIYNKSYSVAMKEASSRSRDRPLHPTDLGVWWTEYVLRHDTAHLKSPGIQQYWWQRRLLDFWAVIFTILLISMYLIVKTFLTLLHHAASLCGSHPRIKKKMS